MELQHPTHRSAGPKSLPGLWAGVVLAAAVVLTLAGVTTSSVGISSLRFEEGDRSGILFGDPLPIRSDEFLRNTPIRLGVQMSGDDGFITPLSIDSGLTSGVSNGPAGKLVFFDTTLAQWASGLPDAQVFAFFWWVPLVVIALGTTYVLLELGVRESIAIGTSALSLLAPAIPWWSVVAPQTTALAIGAVAAIVAAASLLKRSSPLWNRWLGVLLAMIAGVFIARLPLTYPPWTIPLGLLIVVPIVLWVCTGARRKAGLMVTAIAGSVALILFLAVVHEHWTSYEVLAATSYPGSRRSGGGGIGLAYLLSAHFASFYLPSGNELLGINQSEMATGFTVLPLAALSILGATRTSLAPSVRPFAIYGAASFVLLLVWVALPWPGWSNSIPVFNLLPPMRVAQILGIGGLLLFAVMLDGLLQRGDHHTATPLMAGTGITAVLLTAGVALRMGPMPALHPGLIAVLSMLVGASFGFSLFFRSAKATLLTLLALATVATALTGPIMAGVGDLRGQEFEAARRLINSARGEGLVAADSLEANALTEAGAIPSLGGEQSGPSELWSLLDPADEYVESWNRGGMVGFTWTDEAVRLGVSNPQDDIIVVEASPCDRALVEAGLTTAIASRQLTSPCLKHAGQFTWGGSHQFVYQVVPATAHP